MVLNGIKGPVLCAITFLLLGRGGGSSPSSDVARWCVTQNSNILEIAYGKGTDFPQYAALDVNSGYLRLNYGPVSGWGTSVVLPPSFWSGAKYYQGTPIITNWNIDGSDLLITFSGTMTTLGIQGTVQISPPANSAISAKVSLAVNGNVVLDNRPNEAFKPVMLSSMHIAADSWDAQLAFAGLQTYQIPGSGWIIFPAVNSLIFGLKGGTSTWKTNAPTVEIALDQAMQITGWVTNSNNPNDDNIGYWAAADTVLPNWSYIITAKAP